MLINFMSIQSSNGRLLEITQDVGVKVLKLSDVESMKEPLCPAPEVRSSPPLSPVSHYLLEWNLGQYPITKFNDSQNCF